MKPIRSMQRDLAHLRNSRMLLSLKSQASATISGIVILTGLAIAGIVTQRYSGVLRQEMMGQSENLATVSPSMPPTGFINDLVGLQKMLDQQRRIHPALAYLFILKDGQAFAHTFDHGLPAGLLEADQPISPAHPAFGELSPKPGPLPGYSVTHLRRRGGNFAPGIFRTPLRTQLVKLWREIGAMTLGLTFLALGGGLLFVRRITRPLAALVAATREIDQGKANVQVEVKGKDESAALSVSFDQIVCPARRNIPTVWKSRPWNWSGLTARPGLPARSCRRWERFTP